MKKQKQDIKANIVVYQHRRVSDGEIFYIGIGAKNRPYSKLGRNNHWLNYANKYDYVVDILFKDLTWEEACIKEKSLILDYGRRDLNEGTLVNMTNGGEGTCNLTQESRDSISSAMSVRMKGRSSNMLGKTHTAETKLKMSEASKGKHKSEEHKKNMSKALRGKKRCGHSEETRHKMSESAKKREENKRIKILKQKK